MCMSICLSVSCLSASVSLPLQHTYRHEIHFGVIILWIIVLNRDLAPAASVTLNVNSSSLILLNC